MVNFMEWPGTNQSSSKLTLGAGWGGITLNWSVIGWNEQGINKSWPYRGKKRPEVNLMDWSETKVEDHADWTRINLKRLWIINGSLEWQRTT